MTHFLFSIKRALRALDLYLLTCVPHLASLLSALFTFSFLYSVTILIFVSYIWTYVKSLSCIQLFATPWTVTYQSPQSMEFSSKSTGVGCHFLLQGIFSTQGLNLGLPHYRQTLYHLSHQGSPLLY